MIRKFEEKDIEEVMQIWKNENIKGHPFIPKEYWDSHYSFVKEAITNAELYVYLIKEKIVGFVGVDKNYIEGIFVDTNSQCEGIGTALVNKVKETRDTLLLSVYKKNTKAIAFYKKNGFIITKEKTDENTEEVEYTMFWEK